MDESTNRPPLVAVIAANGVEATNFRHAHIHPPLRWCYLASEQSARGLDADVFVELSGAERHPSYAAIRATARRSFMRQSLRAWVSGTKAAELLMAKLAKEMAG